MKKFLSLASTLIFMTTTIINGWSWMDIHEIHNNTDQIVVVQNNAGAWGYGLHSFWIGIDKNAFATPFLKELFFEQFYRREADAQVGTLPLIFFPGQRMTFTPPNFVYFKDKPLCFHFLDDRGRITQTYRIYNEGDKPFGWLEMYGHIKLQKPNGKIEQMKVISLSGKQEEATSLQHHRVDLTIERGGNFTLKQRP